MKPHYIYFALVFLPMIEQRKTKGSNKSKFSNTKYVYSIEDRSPCLCYGVHLNVSGELEGRNSVISLVNPLCWNGQREWLRTFMTNELLALRNGSILTGGENKLSKLCITGTKRETCLGKEKMLRKWENVSITAREASIGLNNMNNLVNIWKSILFGGAQKTD